MISSAEPSIAVVISGNSLPSNANETVPDVPPPLKPVPAVTAVIRPVSVKLIAPVELLYVIPVPPLNKPRTSASVLSVKLTTPPL